MPPKLTRRDSQNSPDNENLGTALKQLCADLTKGKNKKGQTNTPSLVSNIQSILTSYRTKSQKVHNDVLNILINAMYDGGGVEFCSQLEPAVFCIVLDTMLQADVCPSNQPQRGISCLSTSLYRDSTHEDVVDSDAIDTIKYRKAYIGKQCLGRLFKFFSDMETEDSNFMRRWVGILIIELLRGSEENAEIVSTVCSENDRRGIAHVMLNDDDEHVQIIAGEIVKALAETMDLEDLWPLDEEHYYTGFPTTTASNSAWTKSFIKWLDSVYDRNVGLAPQPNGRTFTLSSIELRPEEGFADPSQVAMLYLVDGTLAVLAPAHHGNMIHILDAGLSCFDSIDVVPIEDEDEVDVHVALKVDENLSTQTWIDAIALNLEKMILTMHVSTWQTLREAFEELCPDINITSLAPEDKIDLVGSPESASAEILRVGEMEAIRAASAEVVRYETHDSQLGPDGIDRVVENTLRVRTASVELMQKGPLTSELERNSAGRKLKIDIKQVEIEIQSLPQQPLSAQPESQGKVLEIEDEDEDEPSDASPPKTSGKPAVGRKDAKPVTQRPLAVPPERRQKVAEVEKDDDDDDDDDELSHTSPPKSSGHQTVGRKDAAKPVSKMKTKIRNDVKPQAKPAITRISRSMEGNPEKKASNTIIPSTSKSNKQLKQVNDVKAVDNIHDTGSQAAVKNQAKVQALKSKVKVVGKTPLNRQGPATGSTAKETRMPNKQKTSTTKDMFDIHVDEDDHITSPESSPVKSKPQPTKARTPQNAATRSDQVPQKKRYSLNGSRPMPALEISAPDLYAVLTDDIGAKKSTLATKTPKPKTKVVTKAAVSTDLYAIPTDDTGTEKSKKATKTPRPKTTSVARTAVSTGRIVKTKSPKAPIKPKAKRQSAPAALNEPTSPVRGNRRAAAVRAKQKIHDLDDSDEEFEQSLEADISVKATIKQKPNDPKRMNQETEMTDASEDPNSLGIDSQFKNQKMVSSVNRKSTTDPKKAQNIIESSVQAIKKTSTKSVDSASKDPVEEKVLAELQKSDANAMPEEDFVNFDNNFNTDPESKPASQPFNEPVTAKQQNGLAKKPKSSPDENFADKLGDLLDNISEPDMGDAANPKRLSALRTPAKLLFEEDLPPDTSPFPPSSNLMVQSSPRLVIQEASDQDSGAKNSISRSTKLPSRVSQQIQEGQSASSPPDQQMPNVTTAILSDEFRKPDIPIKVGSVKRSAKEKTAPESVKRHTKSISRDAEMLDKTMQTSMHSNILEDEGEPPSSSTSVNLQGQSHSKQIQKKRKATTDLSPNSKRRQLGSKRDSKTKDMENTPVAKLRSDRTFDLHPGSPDLPAWAHNVKGTTIESVGKDPARKPNLILFDGIQGAINQGHSSTKKPSPKKLAALEVVERKRKREARTVIEEVTHSPPKKRQHSSPFEYASFVDLDDDDVLIIDALPVKPDRKSDSLTAPSDRQRSRSSRQSSQPSRVDKNGSPMAIEKVDHIGQLKKRLSQSNHPESPHDQHTDSAPESTSEVEVGMFAPRAVLSPKKKVRSLPQNEEGVRYVAHEKTAAGQYRDLHSKEVIAAAEEVVEDPFLQDQVNRHTPFAKRLVESKPTEVKKTQALASSQASLLNRIQGRQGSTLPPAKERRGNQRSDHNTTRNASKSKVFGDQKKMLVNSHRRHAREESPSDMTNGSTPDTVSSGAAEDRMPLAEKWNMAIRPHFTTVHDAVHRIADEVIIRLADEEDRMDLVVKQYDENGTVVIDKLLQKREGEKDTIIEGLESKSTIMKHVWSKAREFIGDQAREVKDHPVTGFEKNWRKRQAEIQKLMNDGVESLKS